MDADVQRSLTAVGSTLTVHRDALRAHRAEIIKVKKDARADVARLESMVTELTKTIAKERVERSQAVQVAKAAAPSERAEILKAVTTAVLQTITPVLEALAKGQRAIADELTAEMESIPVRDPETQRILSVVKRRVR